MNACVTGRSYLAQPASSEPSVNWPDVINAVAAALAGQRFPAEGDPPGSPSLLAALTGSAPPGLRRRLQREPAARQAVAGDVEPLIYQNELPVRLLARGIIGIAAHAVASRPGAERPGGSDPRVTAIVALAALSTLRLDQAGDDRAAGPRLAWPGHRFDAAAVDAGTRLARRRTAELDELLRRAAGTAARPGDRSRWRTGSWPRRSPRRSSAARRQASGLPPGSGRSRSTCSAAWPSARPSCRSRTIERWLGIEFLPAPLTPERTASLAALVADEASALEQGCGCKAETGTRRARLTRDGGRAARPITICGRGGQGSRNPAAAPARGTPARCGDGSAAGSAGRMPGGPLPTDTRSGPRLRSNDVASSVLARRWLSGDRGVRRPGPAVRPHPAGVLPDLRQQGPAGRPGPTRPGGRSSSGRPAAGAATGLPQ